MSKRPIRFGPYKPDTSTWETSAEAEARGVKVQRIGSGLITRKTKKTIDAQKLLDSVAGTSKERMVIEFLKSKGIEVEE